MVTDFCTLKPCFSRIFSYLGSTASQQTGAQILKREPCFLFCLSRKIIYLEAVLFAESESHEVAELVARDLWVVSQDLEARFDGGMIRVGFGDRLNVSLHQTFNSVGLQEV
jgi:hypothetical protein